MPILPVQSTARQLDLSTRFAHSEVVVASPAAAAETIICSVTLEQGIPISLGVFLFGWCALTVGTNGVSHQLKLRQTNVSGTTKADSGAVTAVATNLRAPSIQGFDSGPADGQVYKLTLQVASGSAESTVSAVSLIAIPV